ncbi:MAG: hypothetical protein IJS59_03525 [Bacteroidaceae bacterium]|nr:hypothetical protein [Bacteroidaceae bacterium]
MRKNDATVASEDTLAGTPHVTGNDVAAVVWRADGEEADGEQTLAVSNQDLADGGDPDAADGDLASTTDASGEAPVADSTAVGDADVPEAIVAEEPRHSAWKVFSSEDLPQLSLREILGGDYLIKSFLRENIWFILFLVALAVGYITNRYLAQQEVIEEARLRKELVDMKYFALTQGAQLTMRSRQSNIERQLLQNGDSLLRAAIDPPYIIRHK